MKKYFFFLAAAMVALVPFVVTKSLLYPYIHGKTLLFVLLAHLTIIFFLWGRFRGEWPRLKLSWPMGALGVFIAWALAASLFGVNFTRSFWGSWPRLFGLYHLILIFAVVWILATVFDAAQWKKLFTVSVYASVLVSLLAVLQKFMPIFVWSGYRVGSTLDNPSFLAGYLIFSIFLGWWLASEPVARRDKWLLWAITILNVVVLILTRTRGALLGLIIGWLTSAVFLIFHKPTRKQALYWFGILAVLALGVWLFDPETLRRIQETSLADPSVRSRLMIWSIAWHGFAARPIGGWGFENFNAVANIWYNPAQMIFSYGETFADKAHNLPLEYLTTLGAGGLIAYLGMFVTLAAVMWRQYKKGITDFLNVAIFIGMWFAYLISLSFLFDQLLTFLFFALTVAFLHTRAKEGCDARTNPLSAGRYGLLIILLLASGYFGFLKPLTVSADDHQAVSIFNENPVQGEAIFQKALAWSGPWYADVMAEEAGTLNSFLTTPAAPGKLPIEIIEAVYARLLSAQKKFPYDIRFPAFIGYMGNWLGVKKLSYLPTTNAALVEALNTLSPKRQQIMYLLAENYMLQETPLEAARVAREAIALEPAVADSYYYLGNALLMIGDETGGLAMIKEAERRGYPAVGIKPYQLLISIAIDHADWPKAVTLYKQAIIIEPTNAPLFAQLAAVYSRMGKRQEAISAVLEAVRLNPKLKAEADKFLQSLR